MVILKVFRDAFFGPFLQVLILRDLETHTIAVCAFEFHCATPRLAIGQKDFGCKSKIAAAEAAAACTDHSLT